MGKPGDEAIIHNIQCTSNACSCVPGGGALFILHILGLVIPMQV